MTRFQKILLAGAAIAAIAPAAANADQTSSGAPPGNTTQVADAGTPQLASNGMAAPETVVVTARHTAEREEDVPISMSVLSGDQLDQNGSYTLYDLQHSVPGLVAYDSNPRNSSIGIRGLGVTSAQDGLDTSVGVYVDGVYEGRPGMALADLIDIDQLEVLRGPQGTLYGRNAAAGALNITTKAPSFDPSFTAEGSFGSYDYNQERFTATGPLADDLAYRLTGYNTYRDGTTYNYKTGGNDNGLERNGGRLQLLYTPTSNLTVRLIADFSTENDTSNVSSITLLLPSTLSTAVAHTQTALAETGWTPIATPHQTGINAIQDMRTRQGSSSAQIDYNLGWAEFTSISAFRYWSFYPLQDSDSTPLDILQVNVAKTRDWQETQEFRLASKPGGDFSWQVGAFYFHQFLLDHYILNQYGYDAGAFLTNYARLSNPAAPAVTIAPGSQYLDNVATTADSVAGFAQANWEIFKGLTLTGGIRFTQDWRSGTAQSSVDGTIPTSLTPAIGVDQSISGDNVSGLGSLSYKIADDSLVYASWSQGYQSAGLNLDSAVPSSEVIVQPEQANDYEVGIKQGLLDDHLVFNGDLYWTVLSGLQANYYPSNGAKSYLTNVGRVLARGAEIEADYAVDDHFSFGVNGSYNDAYYSSYTNAPCPIGTTGICNLTGKPVYEAPRWVGNANASYGFDYSASIHPYANAQYSYTSDYNGTIDDSPYTRVKAYGLLNLRVGAALNGGKYDVAFWVNNALDKHYFVTGGLASLPGASSFGVAEEPGTPLTFGVTARANF
jgi:iron complex outermembrane receptor protein